MSRHAVTRKVRPVASRILGAAVYDILQNVVGQGARFVPNLAREDRLTVYQCATLALFVADPLMALAKESENFFAAHLHILP